MADKIKLTDRKLKALKPARQGDRYEIADAEVSGLGVRVTDKGKRTFFLLARYPGSNNPTRRALGERSPALAAPGSNGVQPDDRPH